MSRRITYDDAKKEVESYSMELISDAYTNLQTPLIVVCEIHSGIEASLAEIRARKGCPLCNPKQERIAAHAFNEKPMHNTPLELWRIKHEVYPAELASLIDYDLTVSQYLAIESGQVEPTQYFKGRIRILTGITEYKEVDNMDAITKRNYEDKITDYEKAISELESDNKWDEAELYQDQLDNIADKFELLQTDEGWEDYQETLQDRFGE